VTSQHANIELVIFDNDGVLVDSEALTHRVLAQISSELGAAMSSTEALEMFRGGKLQDCIDEIERRTGTTIPDDFETLFRIRCETLYRAELRPIEGVKALVEALPWPRCVASSGPHIKIRQTLDIVGLLPLFDGHIYSAYDIDRFKPDPALFLYAAAEMGTPPERCLVIEDSLHGVHAGIAAGMRVFGYAGEGNPAELADAGAEVVTQMSEIQSILSSEGLL